MSMIPRVRLLLVATLLACNPAPEQASRDAPPVTSSSAAPRSASSAAPLATGPERPSAASSGGASPAPAGEIAGTWEGHYDAKKGEVTLPPKVKDKAIAADDGKTASGRGAIELVILPDGDVRGKTSGALGAGTISGKVDGAMIRALVRPDEPLAATAMTGIFIAQRKGETLAGEMRVAGPDGTMIRESAVELTRKK